MPDAVGHPFRVDIAIQDPDVPVVSFVYYHDVNRLVRVDATVDHETEITCCPNAPRTCSTRRRLRAGR